MIILSIMTAIAFSHKDFKDSSVANSFFKKARIGLVAATFRDVLANNINDAYDDLKEFSNPFHNKGFTVKGDRVVKGSFHEENLVGEADQKATLHDKIVIYPNSLGSSEMTEEINSGANIFGTALGQNGNGLFESNTQGRFGRN